jgi:uncharacterized protein (TIGR02594 family)
MKGIDFAKACIGMTEQKDGQELMHMFREKSRKEDIVVNPAITPWCAAFVNWAERSSGKAGTGKLTARSFLTYGTPVKLDQAQEGDIVVFKRGNSSWEGHVTYFCCYDEENKTIECLGGNQKDSVCYSAYPLSQLLGIRRS